MKVSRFMALCGVSYAAFAAAGFAQEIYELDPINISLIEAGQENIEATGGAVISEEDIQAIQPQNLSELFSRESGVTVSGGAGPSKRVYVFGMEQSNLAVTVDGVPQGVTSWHHTGSNVVDTAFLKSVEVEAGISTADAGFGAAAGSLRYETVSAGDLLEYGDNFGGRASLGYSDNGNTLTSSLAAFGDTGNFDYLVVLSNQTGDDYTDGSGTEVTGSEAAAQGLMTKLGYEWAEHRVELSYEHSEDSADRVIKMNMDLNHDDTVYPLDITNDIVSLRYTTTAPTDVWNPEILLYYSENNYWRPNYVVDGRNGDMELDNGAIGGKIENTFTVQSGSIVTGVDFAYQDYSVDNYGDVTGTPEIQNLDTMQVGAYVQGRFEFDNGIDLSTGLRADHMIFNDMDGQRFEDSGISANLTASYEFAPGFEVFAGASQTWVGYDIGEYGLMHARDYDFASDYAGASSTNYKIGVNGSRGAFTGGLTYFDIKVEDYANYDWTVDEINNGGEVRSKGMTLNLAYNYANGRIGGSYTKADVSENGDAVLPAGGSIVPVSDLATLYVDHNISDQLKVGGTVAWAGTLDSDLMSASNFYAHDSYTVVNAYAEYKPQQVDGLTLRLGVDNLFDEYYYERSSYVYTEISDTRIVYPQYAEGRAISLTATVDF
ncbi:TonB-dependent receptor domain-containing protein [Pacificibacter marinus]|uniref:TonB-dependent receptor domain-containing protein n=1 Tax=Pacificibacter marinus TaxID=658057 RepID=UPI001C06AB43|nr:TonB-dependent receptor [Pacificibacter marinus]MBU2865645.1 TonB-dependent receptor [Pacificibacter marinus]